MAKSMGIGSPIAQIGGIVGGCTIDNFVKIVCGENTMVDIWMISI